MRRSLHQACAAPNIGYPSWSFCGLPCLLALGWVALGPAVDRSLHGRKRLEQPPTSGSSGRLLCVERRSLCFAEGSPNPAGLYPSKQGRDSRNDLPICTEQTREVPKLFSCHISDKKQTTERHNE